ncbi:MAG: DUF6250 domain-containing protein [Sedimentisphaeraceae bacterium JB056]
MRVRRYFSLIFAAMFIFMSGCCNNLDKTKCKSGGGLEPKVLGYGQEAFKIGELIYSSDFTYPENWIIQIQPKDGFEQGKVVFENNKLDAFMPGRGCTIWFNKELHNGVTIVYDVVCPSESAETDGIQVRDINNFWMASGPPEASELFNPADYSGAFLDYHKINCYYASTGGGGAKGNQTTRFRIYPRKVNGENVPHLALQYRDGIEDYLITPDKKHTIQLTAFDDIIQYIVDGKVVYEIKNGDEVKVQSITDGGIEFEDSVYNTAKSEFPMYTKGYFGLRMVASHHLYSNFRVYKLDALK